MTTHATAYESLSSRSHPSGSLRPDQSFGHSFTAVPIIGSNFYLLPQPLIPLSGYKSLPVSSAQIIEVGATRLLTQAWGAYAEVEQAGTTTVSGGPFLGKNDQSVTSINSGRLAPQIMLDFTGLTRPASAATVQGTISYAYSDSVYQGQSHFCEFEDWPPDTQVNGSFRLKTLLEGIVHATTDFQVGINGSGAAIKVDQCGFAAVAPEGFVYIRPEDVGTAPDQIPASGFDNTAAAYRAHPSVFYPSGKTAYLRALTRQAVDSVDIVSSGGGVGSAIGIVVVTAAPTFSDWLVSVDGQMQVVRLPHPAGSDFRRPRDIWNEVWVPIITGGSNVAAATVYGQVVGDTDATAFRWQYADYFRCLPLIGTNTTQSFGG